MDISEFGLEATAPTGRSIAQVGPRFYMTYVDEVWFFLFAPGKRDCIVGSSGRISRNEQHYDSTILTKWAADETEIVVKQL
jgi:hypothetical protein